MLESVSNPLVSIVMPAYNSGKTIRSSIKSVIDQIYINWELLVINDGSNDDTIIEIKTFLSDSRILLFNQDNKGVASARNNGIKRSKGKYIAFIDADDIWYKEKLKLQIEYFQSNSIHGLVHTGNMIFRDKVENAVLNKYIEPFKVENDYYRLLISDYIVTSTVIINKEILKNEIFFDEKLVGTEDWDLWIQISKRHKIAFIPNPLIYYREHAAGISKNYVRQLYNDLLVREKNVYNNVDIPQKIIIMSKWMFQKKNIFVEAKKYSIWSTLKQYLIMVLRFPLYIETYKFPIKFIFNKVVSKSHTHI